MYGVHDLAERFGLSVHQVRDRLTALEPVLGDHLVRGKQNAKLLKGSGLSILDRLVQLERDGVQLETAVKIVQDELTDGIEAETEATPNVRQSDRTQELIEQLYERIHEYQRREEHLLKMLEDQGEQLQALMPGSPEGSTPTPTGNGGRERMGRWEHLKAAILGSGR